jgi:OmpA family
MADEQLRASRAKLTKGIKLSAPGTFTIKLKRQRAAQLELHDDLFRTNSAVVMPDGDPASPAPAQGATVAEQPDPLSAIARVLRFIEENDERKILVAGHTDSEGGEAANQALSEERAKLAHALLTGSRDAFAETADKRHRVGDYKQILRWAALNLTGLEPVAGGAPPEHDFSACDPGEIDENANTGVMPLRAFQQAYNSNKPALGASAEDLRVDGAIGPKTWGAIYDCYDFAIRRALGEDAAETKKLRSALVFLLPDKPFLGFGESHPIDAVGKDNFKSQTNRRVEILFFEEDDEPDLNVLKNDPAGTEVYLPGAYERIEVPGPGTALRIATPLRLETMDGDAIPDIEFSALVNDGSTREGRLNGKGTATIKLAPDATFEIEYKDLDAIHVNALASTLARGLDASEHTTVAGTLSQARPVFEAMKATIDKFFPRPGGDLVQEIRDKLKGTDSETAGSYFLAGLGAVDGGSSEPSEVIAFQEPALQGGEGETAVV